MTTLIERNTTVPVKKSQIFSTAEDGQTAVDIHVLQGERTMASDNMSLGRFRLEGVPSAPRGIPQIEVVFDIDANGILNVSAIDKASSREQHVTITASTNMDKAEIERLVQESKQKQAEDERRKKLVESRNMADNIVYQAEKLLQDQGGSINPEDRDEIERLMVTIRQLMAGEDNDEIARQAENLHKLVEQARSRLHASDHGQTAGNGHKPATDPDEEVLEGEFSEA
jgi:molecular chaperone DnaK